MQQQSVQPSRKWDVLWEGRHHKVWYVSLGSGGVGQIKALSSCPDSSGAWECLVPLYLFCYRQGNVLNIHSDIRVEWDEALQHSTAAAFFQSKSV